MGKATRRGFLRLFGLGALAFSPFATLIPLSGRPLRKTKVGTIRIKPVEPSLCTPSFVRFCKRATFKTVADAMKVARRTDQPYVIYLV